MAQKPFISDIRKRASERYLRIAFPDADGDRYRAERANGGTPLSKVDDDGTAQHRASGGRHPLDEAQRDEYPNFRYQPHQCAGSHEYRKRNEEDAPATVSIRQWAHDKRTRSEPEEKPRQGELHLRRKHPEVSRDIGERREIEICRERTDGTNEAEEKYQPEGESRARDGLDPLC
mgnify:CR=1 FL=1